MRSKQRAWQRFVADIRNLQYIDVYTLAAFLFLFAVLTTFPELVPEEVEQAAIMAALGLLVYYTTVPKTQETNVDDLLSDRTNFPPFMESIQGATQLWIYAASAVNILTVDNIEAIRRNILSRADGEFRVVLQDPTEHEALRIAVRQIDDALDYQVQHLPADIEETLQRLQKIDSWEKKGRFAYRLLDYSPGFSIVAIDPQKPHGQIIVEFYGFHNVQTTGRMYIKLDRTSSDYWYTYWVSQFEYIWNDSREVTARIGAAEG
jgi:hypothetical protein